jgi:hypothetical protein
MSQAEERIELKGREGTEIRKKDGEEQKPTTKKKRRRLWSSWGS